MNADPSTVSLSCQEESRCDWKDCDVVAHMPEMYAHRHALTHIHTCTDAHTRVHIHRRTHTWTHAQTHTHMDAYTDAHTHVHIDVTKLMAVYWCVRYSLLKLYPPLQLQS